jgi:hypothetical protein
MRLWVMTEGQPFGAKDAASTQLIILKGAI